ncbi:PRC-barrel domain-containing protein [Microvirga splendida]|uniref:PRC-barrel domain-containing protein n=1 Tax=Microvirga splendida TaxID=2795727 RepID=A0ABS0Y3V1_9HYPH|nr:PRC-barrel domain-containing protein [Microvirga splendida]MBJ6126986.1 PRC-barrel domain-containing protein [Microvirga splendida]
MLRMQLAAGLAATALLTGAALAQTAAPAQPTAPGQVMTKMPPGLMRGSQLIGTDVYGADNQKIGDIDEVLVDRQGRIHGLVVGVGGFLGIGRKDVAIPFDQVQWMSSQEVQASAGAGQRGANTADPAVPSTATGGLAQPSTTGSTGSTVGTARDPNIPARAMVRMTKADLRNAPEFRYSMDAGRAGAAGNTNPPPQTVNTPGNAPANTPRQ